MLTQELRLTRMENASLLEKNQLAPPGTIRAGQPPPPPISNPEDFSENTAAVMDAIMQQKNFPQQCVGMDSQFSNSMVVAGPMSAGN